MAGGELSVDINGSPIRGVYLDVDPPHSVVVSWGIAGDDEHPPGSSRVEFTLTEISGGLPAKLMRALPTLVADVVPTRSDDRSSSNLNPEVDVLIP